MSIKVPLKLSTKLLLLFFSVIIIHTIVSLTALTLIISRTNMSTRELQVENTTTGVSRYLGKLVNDLQVKAKLFSEQEKIINYTEFGLYNLLKRQLDVYWETLGIDTITIYSNSLKPVASIGQHFVPDRRFTSSLKDSLDGKTLRFFTMGEKHPVIVVTLPIRRSYTHLGVMAIGISIDEQFIAGLETIFNTKIIFRINNTMISNNFDPLLIHDLMTFSPRDQIANYQIKRIPSFLFYISGGVVYCLYDTSAMHNQIKGYTVTSIGISLIVLFSALFIGAIFYRKTFQRPFQSLMEGINMISGGTILPPFKNPGKDEFGELASSFNLMCNNLLKREKEIARLSSYNSLILDNMKSGILTFDLKGEITTINPSARIILLGPQNNEHEDYSMLPDYFPAEFNALVNKVLEGKSEKSDGEIVISGGKDKKIVAYRFSSLLSQERDKLGLIMIIEDVTKVRTLEEKLIVSSRLAVLGEMAAGVAHQIKNPLAVMKVSMQMLVDDLAYPSQDTEEGDLSGFILNEIDTLDSVVNNFLAFARPQRGVKTYEEIEELIDFSLRGISPDKSEGIHIVKTIAPEADQYLFDRNLIIQVLSNILINAFECSKEGDTVYIAAYRGGGKFIISIKDEGKGMSEEIQSKIFDPFYTTKETGTGLGLSIVHRIVEDEGGTIEVESAEGAGTRIKLIFGSN